MKDYLIGLFAFMLITYTLFFINARLSPVNHFSLLEWVGLMGITIIIKAGLDTYQEEITEHH